MKETYLPRSSPYVLRGYIPAQSNLTYMNMAVKGVKNPEARFAHLNRLEERTENFLSWIDATYSPKRVLYPFCGWHITPREIFGEHKVVHLSLDDCHDHLIDLGTGERVKGDAFSLPFQDDTFDAVFLRSSKLKKDQIEQAFSELRKSVKDDGLFIVENIGKNNLMEYCKKRLKKAEVPKDIEDFMKGQFGLFLNADKPNEPRRFLWWKR